LETRKKKQRKYRHLDDIFIYLDYPFSRSEEIKKILKISSKKFGGN